ncbi:pyridoxal-phosphate dependent enzyme [Roseisalinus antarcticus]|uniref:Diaminopropionate ammonia-lyase n=1 Tax=Roseisalinus antarcticus TaxID=254357 RepID=A0A1Y5SEH6_9RHOB|nr:pyridoxal-phosphate dependent enzyme [Roseisalinus antarcticus]SLN37330.1 Diaminopropionate ammonia-lyase [Roseisalinus antarcticus]
MKTVINSHCGTGLSMPDVPYPSQDMAAPLALLARCPEHRVTPLLNRPDLAALADVATVHVKDERDRMGLGSFKALGAAYVIACDAAEGAAKGRTYVTASAGNHGLSVAAGAAAFGARAQVYIAETVPEAFAQRLAKLGARVTRAGATYEDSMAAAEADAAANGWTLLSDSSWPGYMTRPHRLMEGYLALMAEVFDQLEVPPTHILLQAGVGGLAGAAAAAARAHWGATPTIVVVEPEAAPALHASLAAGEAVTTAGPVSAMGRLDCKTPSLIALQGLARDADLSALITEDEAATATARLAGLGLASTPSGAAGLAALLSADRAGLGLSSGARVLAILSEGPE